MWRSLVAHLAWDEGVARSNRVIPTILKRSSKGFFFSLYLFNICLKKLEYCQIFVCPCFNIYMEGQVGNVFETQFRYAIRNNSNGSVSMPSIQKNNEPSELLNKSQSFISQETKDKHVNHLLRNSSIAAGIGVVILAPFVMLISKGKFPKISNYITKRLNKISQKISELRDKPQMTKAEMVYLNSLQKTNKTLNSVKGLLLNSGPLKDVLFDKTLRKVGLGRLCNKITGFFERMALKMTSIAYKSSNDAFALMKEGFSQTNKALLNSKTSSKVETINGVTKTVSEWVKIAEEKLEHIDNLYESFRPVSVSKRNRWLGKQFNGLGDKVFEQTYGNFWGFVKNPKSWTSFITEDLVATTKDKYSRNIISRKKLITNTHSDVTKELDKFVSNIEGSLDLTNKSSYDLLKRIKKLVSSYDISASDNKKQEIVSDISKMISDCSLVLENTSSKYPEAVIKKVKKSLGNIRYIISSDKQGELEEVMNIYKHILPEGKYSELKKSSKRMREALNNATDTEADKFVDKMRDLKSGSAISDVGFGLLFPLGSTAVAMSMADTKEKKRSVGLNFGIPLFVGLATSMWGTIAMLAAGPSMALGLVTSTITNQICSRIDNSLKKKDAEKLSAQTNSQSTTKA